MAQTATTQDKQQIAGLQNMINNSFNETSQESKMMSMDDITKAVNVTDPASINAENVTPENKKYVDGIVDAIMDQDFANPEVQEGLNQLMEQFQNQEIEKAVFKSEKLNERMLKMAGTADGGVLLDKMTECDLVMNNLHPKNNSLRSKWWHFIPFVVKPMRKYMMLVQTQQDVLQGFKNAINEGIAERKRDMAILKNDKVELKKMAIVLENSIQAAMYLDERLSVAAANIEDERQRVFMQTEMVYTLRKTIEALQEQLIVVNQGQLAMEQIIRLLDILCSSAKRTMNVAMLALQISMVIASVLAGAKDLIDKTNQMKATANDFLAHNAEQLTAVTDQVIELDTNSTLDMSVVEQVFDSIHSNIERSTQSRLDNLDVVKDRIQQYETINQKSKEFVNRLDRGNKAAASIADKLGTSSLPESIAVQS